jgi:hypothetical protein
MCCRIDVSFLRVRSIRVWLFDVPHLIPLELGGTNGNKNLPALRVSGRGISRASTNLRAFEFNAIGV